MVHLGLPQREAHLIETVTRLVDLPTLILQGYHLTHHQEVPTPMMAIQQVLSYREERPRDYDPVPGSKRPYAALDDVPPRYAEALVRQSRACMDYEMGGQSSQCVDAYTDRLIEDMLYRSLLLLLWYLDPQTLVEDVSQVLQDVVGRPFLCLSDELFEMMKWRSIIICLAFSPVLFIDTRALLHRWFLLTGLASVLELQVELISMMLDLLSRPMRWGLSAEIESKLPFSYAYFLFKHQLFRILAGPLSRDRFLELVHKIKKSVSNTKKKLKHVASATSMVDRKSSWSMAMNFPSWFYFAALLLPGNNLSDSYVYRRKGKDVYLQDQTEGC